MSNRFCQKCVQISHDAQIFGPKVVDGSANLSISLLNATTHGLARLASEGEKQRALKGHPYALYDASFLLQAGGYTKN